MSDVLVLSYHAVSDGWPSPLAVTPQALRAQVAGLLARGYVPTTATAAVHAPPAARAFAVTFDDAYRSVLTAGLPVLRGLGVPATVFVPTDFPGAERPLSWPGIDHWLGGAHEHELSPLSWEELRTLAASGWEIGSHTCSHPRLTRLGDAELHAELARSRELCAQQAGAPCDSLAYPYGDHDRRVVEAARAAGYAAAFTVPARLRADDPLRRPRVGVYRDESALSFRAKCSPAVRRLRRAPGTRPALAAMRRLRRRAAQPAAQEPDRAAVS